MKSFFLSPFLFIILFFEVSCSNDLGEINSSLIPQNRNYNVVEEIMEMRGKLWLDSLCSKSFQGRRAGTEGNHLASEFLFREIVGIGYAPEIQFFETESGVLMKNLIVTIPGQSDSIIVIGAHYDGAVQSSKNYHYPAANDNASGTVALLMVLEQLSYESKNKDKTIICCFWDGEETFEGKSFRGSSFFVNNANFLSKILCYLNLDTIGHSHDNDHDGLVDVYMEYLGDEKVVSLAHLIANNGRFSYHIPDSIYFNSDYTPFYKFGIPFINYHDHYNISCEYKGHSTSDIKDVISLDKLIKISHNVCESIDSF